MPKKNHTAGLCATIIVHLVLLLVCLTVTMKTSQKPDEQLEILLDFQEQEPKPEPKPQIHAETGREPKAVKPSPEKEIKLVQKSEAPIKAIAENKSDESIVDEKGDVEQPAPEKKPEIIKKALFSSARNKKDSVTAAHVAEKVSDRLKAGHSEGNAESGNPEGTPTARLDGRSVVGYLPVPEYNIQERGTVVVEIRVNNNGDVTYAEVIPKTKEGEYRTTVANRTLWDAAKEAAKKAKFNVSKNAVQTGTIIYHFELK